jgi:hypothetical protein
MQSFGVHWSCLLHTRLPVRIAAFGCGRFAVRLYNTPVELGTHRRKGSAFPLSAFALECCCALVWLLASWQKAVGVVKGRGGVGAFLYCRMQGHHVCILVVVIMHTMLRVMHVYALSRGFGFGPVFLGSEVVIL